MAAFPKLVLTSAGIALQTKVQGGATLELTNIQMGSGQLNGQPIGPLTALISSNATVPIQSGQAIGQNTYQVEGFFTNADLSAGFWWREIGIFANDPDNGEILYAYANAGDAGDYIPTVTDQRIEKYIYFSMTLANATTVTVTIPQTDTYVLQSTVGQANGVAGLGENGAVPVAQGGTGAVTASAALAALGGMRASATGEDIPTSSTDPTSISSQLSNRLRLPIAIPANADLNDYVSPGMYFCSANAQNVANIPPDSITGAFSLFVEKTGAYGNGCKQTFTDNNQGITYTRVMSDVAAGHWSDWKTLATATPPQVFDLPLADGWTEHRASEYFKTQENIVTVYFQVHTSSPQGGEIILARLPEGFRPQNTIGGSGYCGISGEKNVPADMKVYPNGDINGFNDVGAAEYYTGFFTFVAAS